MNERQTAATLRRDFDATFIAPAAPARILPARFIVLRVLGIDYAIRLSEVAAIERVRALTHLPGAPAMVLGVTGLRGRLVTVVSLARALAHGSDEKVRWMATTKEDDSVALAFSDFDGYHEASPNDVLPTTGVTASREHVFESLVIVGTPRGVVSLQSLLMKIRQDSKEPHKER